jgi:hypothetical protein
MIRIKTLSNLALAFLFSATSASAAVHGVLDAFRADLKENAAKSGLEIQTDQLLTIVRDGVTASFATPAGFEQIDPQNLKAGTDFAYGYLDAPGSGIPTGYYTLRATAEEGVNLGLNNVRVDFVDSNGRVVARRGGMADVTSLTVPNPLPFPQSIVEGVAETVNLKIRLSIWVRCPNGAWICVSITININWFGQQDDRSIHEASN